MFILKKQAIPVTAAVHIVAPKLNSDSEFKTFLENVRGSGKVDSWVSQPLRGTEVRLYTVHLTFEDAAYTWVVDQERTNRVTNYALDSLKKGLFYAAASWLTELQAEMTDITATQSKLFAKLVSLTSTPNYDVAVAEDILRTLQLGEDLLDALQSWFDGDDGRTQ